jgi:predicted nucleic acid-binding protein
MSAELYLDASALVKRYVEEDGSDVVLEAMGGAGAWSICRIGFVETVRAVDAAGGGRAVKRIERDWLAFDVVEIDQALVEHAAELARSSALRSLDALHLAAALAAREQGLSTLPGELR